MPKGVNVEVDDGFATIDFVDVTLRGPALEKLAATGAPIEVQTRSGPRKRYVVPEGNAKLAGLLDKSTTLGSLPTGDTGFAQALVDADPNVNPGEDEADWHHPVLTSKDNAYVGVTSAAENNSYPTVSTTVSGDVPASKPVSLLHSEVITTVREATNAPVATGDDGPDDSWTIPDLKAYAEARGIDLGGATKKADILDLLRKP